MPSEQIRFWLESIGSVAGVAALAAIALELIRARRADTRDFLFHTHEKYNEIRKEQDLLLSLKFSQLEDYNFSGSEENMDAWVSVFGFWNLIASTTRAKAIDKNIVIEQFARPFLRFYEKFSEAGHQLVEEQGGLNWFNNIDWLADETIKRFPGEVEAMKKGRRESIFTIR